MSSQQGEVIQEVNAPTGAALILGLMGGFIGAAMGAATWAVLAYFTHREMAWAAVGVGILAGAGVYLASGKRRGVLFQVTAVVLAVLGILVGKYLLFTIQAILDQGGQQGLDQIGLTLFTPELLQEFLAASQENFSLFDILFLGLAILAAWRVSVANFEQLGSKLSAQ